MFPLSGSNGDYQNPPTYMGIRINPFSGKTLQFIQKQEDQKSHEIHRIFKSPLMG
jgi:hypothetical protein